tara:strand:- start:1129 stop:1323 length:195 start_codon:yes stop_codon:yes gene_type:complete
MALLAVLAVAVQLTHKLERLPDWVAQEILHPPAQVKVAMEVLQQRQHNTVLAVVVALLPLVRME